MQAYVIVYDRKIGKIMRQRIIYDTYGVRYYIQGNNLIAQAYIEEAYQWRIQEKYEYDSRGSKTQVHVIAYTQ